APDCTAGLVNTAAGTLDVLHITVNFQTFKVRTHDDVHHTSYRIRTVESRAAVSQYLNTLHHYQWQRIDIHKLTTGRSGCCSRHLSLAVYQRQRGVFPQVAQVDIGHARQVSGGGTSTV